MDKQKFIEVLGQKGIHNSIISLYYNIGRALPFTAQRFPDGRVSDWYRNQYVEVHEVKPGGKGGRYGEAFGFYFRNGERANSSDSIENSWCRIDDTEPQPIPCAACGSWVLLDILGEPTAEPTKVYGIDDTFEKGKHKGEKLRDVIHSDWNWVKWASLNSEQFYFDLDEVIEERRKDIKVLGPDDIIPFGKYQGQTLRSVAEENYQYVLWLKENTEDYIIDLDSLNKKE